jgi:hypothetical protein
MTLDFILHYVVVLHACAIAMKRPSHTLIDMTYCRAERKVTPASINRSIRISVLHNVVERERNTTARFRCSFCNADGPVYDSAHTSILIIRIFPISWVIRGCLSEYLGIINFFEVRL